MDAIFATLAKHIASFSILPAFLVAIPSQIALDPFSGL
jgi:hypothetical protein